MFHKFIISMDSFNIQTLDDINYSKGSEYKIYSFIHSSHSSEKI